MPVPRSRWNTRPDVRIETDPRPPTGVLALLSLLLSGALPIAVYIVLDRTEEDLAGALISVGIAFAGLFVCAAFVHWRAGRAGSAAAMTVRVLVYTIGILTAGAVTFVFWNSLQDTPVEELKGLDLLIPLGIWALVTFLLVALMLSAVRNSAHRIKVH